MVKWLAPLTSHKPSPWEGVVRIPNLRQVHEDQTNWCLRLSGCRHLVTSSPPVIPETNREFATACGIRTPDTCRWFMGSHLTTRPGGQVVSRLHTSFHRCRVVPPLRGTVELHDSGGNHEDRCVPPLRGTTTASFHRCVPRPPVSTAAYRTAMYSFHRCVVPRPPVSTTVFNRCVPRPLCSILH